MQPLSGHSMRVLMRLRMGAHSLLVVWAAAPAPPCPALVPASCDQHSVEDERHMKSECPALHNVRDQYVLVCYTCTLMFTAAGPCGTVLG